MEAEAEVGAGIVDSRGFRGFRRGLVGKAKSADDARVWGNLLLVEHAAGADNNIYINLNNKYNVIIYF